MDDARDVLVGTQSASVASVTRPSRRVLLFRVHDMGRACLGACHQPGSQVRRVFKNHPSRRLSRTPLRAPDDSWTRTRTFRAETPVAPFPVEPLEPAENLSRRLRMAFLAAASPAFRSAIALNAAPRNNEGSRVSAVCPRRGSSVAVRATPMPGLPTSGLKDLGNCVKAAQFDQAMLSELFVIADAIRQSRESMANVGGTVYFWCFCGVP